MRIAAAITVALLILASTAFAENQDAECVALVEQAEQAFKDKGKEYALKLIGLSSGPLRRGDLYVFAVSYQGVILAHPVNRDLVGVSQMDMKDTKGKFFIREFIDVAKDRSHGWVEYWWLRHGETEPTLKRSYIKRVPHEDLLVGAGYYVK